MNKIKYIAAVLIAVAGFGLQQAKADFVSTLNVGNSAISGYSGPFGTVTVTLVGQVATISFDANTTAGYFFVDTSAAAVQVNSTSFTEAIVTDSDFKGFLFGKTVDGFGTFDLTVNNKSASVLVSSIVFTLTNTDLTNLWTSASDVLAFKGGFDAAAHISIPSGGVTGFAAENGAGVPDGGTTVALLGLGLAGVGVLRRKLRRA
jgi:hypothetical protein